MENAFKYYFLPDHIRGEWYNVTSDEGATFIEETIESLSTWGISQVAIEERMMAWARKLNGLPRNAPVDECGLRTLQSLYRRM